MTPAHIHTRIDGSTATICIGGRATCMQAPALRAFLARAGDAAIRRFDIGLDTCEYMDSTMLGVLAMLAMGQRDGRWSLELINTPPAILAQLVELGLRPFLRFATRPMPAPATLEPLECGPAADLQGIVREAHGTLARIDPANAARFAHVLDLLGRAPPADAESARPDQDETRHSR